MPWSDEALVRVRRTLSNRLIEQTATHVFLFASSATCSPIVIATLSLSSDVRNPSIVWAYCTLLTARRWN